MAEDSKEDLKLMPEKLTIGQLLEIFSSRFPVIITSAGRFNGSNILRDIQPGQVLVATHVVEQKRLFLKSKTNKAIISIPEFFPHRIKLINRFDRVIKIETVRDFLSRSKKDKSQNIEFEIDFNNVRTSSGSTTTANQLGKMKFHDVSFEQFLVVHPIENYNITFNPTAIPVDAEIRVQIVQGHKEMSEDEWLQLMKKCSSVFEEDNSSEPPDLNQVFVWYESTSIQNNSSSSYNGLSKKQLSATIVSTKSKQNLTSGYQSYYSIRNSSRGQVPQNEDSKNRVMTNVTVARFSDSNDGAYHNYKSKPGIKQTQTSRAMNSKNKSIVDYAHHSKPVKIVARRNHLEEQRGGVQFQPQLSQQHQNQKLSSPRFTATVEQPQHFKFNEVGKPRPSKSTLSPKNGVISVDSKFKFYNQTNISPLKTSSLHSGRKDATADKLLIKKSKTKTSWEKHPENIITLNEYGKTVTDTNNNSIVTFNRMTIESDEDEMDQVDADEDGVFIQIKTDEIKHNVGLSENQFQIPHNRRDENFVTYQKRSYSVPPGQLRPPQQSLKVVGDSRSKKQLSEDTKCMFIDDSGSDDADVESQTTVIHYSSNNINSHTPQKEFPGRSRDNDQVMFFDVEKEIVGNRSSKMGGQRVEGSRKQIMVVNQKTDDFLPLKESSRKTEIYRDAPIYTENPLEYRKTYRYSGEVVVKKANRGNLYAFREDQAGRSRYMSDSEFSDVEKMPRHRMVSYRFEDRVYVSPPKYKTSKSSVRMLSDAEQHTIRQKNLKEHEVHLRDSRNISVPHSQRNSRISYSSNEVNEPSYVFSGSPYGQHFKPAPSEKIQMINSRGDLFIRKIPLTYIPNHSASPGAMSPASHPSQPGIYKQVINISG